MAYNPYINSFATESGYTEYIEGNVVKTPNVAYIKDIDEMRYVKILPTEEYVIYGTTTGTSDWTNKGFTFHVVESLDGGDNIFYSRAGDIQNPSLYQLFNTTEGNKITSIKKWTVDTSNATSMENTFYNCSNLTLLNLTSFDTTKVIYSTYTFYGCSSLNKLYIGQGFFNGTSITNYGMFTDLSAWTDADSIEQFVQAAEMHDGTGKTIRLSSQTKNAMTQAQKDRITGAGWTLQ